MFANATIRALILQTTHRFNVSVDESLTVQISDGRQNLAEERASVHLTEAAALNYRQTHRYIKLCMEVRSKVGS